MWNQFNVGYFHSCITKKVFSDRLMLQVNSNFFLRFFFNFCGKNFCCRAWFLKSQMKNTFFFWKSQKATVCLFPKIFWAPYNSMFLTRSKLVKLFQKKSFTYKNETKPKVKKHVTKQNNCSPKTLILKWQIFFHLKHCFYNKLLWFCLLYKVSARSAPKTLYIYTWKVLFFQFML